MEEGEPMTEYQVLHMAEPREGTVHAWYVHIFEAQLLMNITTHSRSERPRTSGGAFSIQISDAATLMRAGPLMHTPERHGALRAGDSPADVRSECWLSGGH